MATLFRLPLLGQTMQEGTILRWLKQEGEAVEGWEPLVEVMTDKVNMEVEPAVAGVVRKLLVPEGETVAVGAAIAVIGAADESIEELLSQLNGGAAGSTALAARPPEPTPAVETGGDVPPAGQRVGREPPAVSPRAREVAREAGIEWKELALPGTGFEGMIVERDVRAFLEGARRERPRLTPLARKIAAEHGVEPEKLAAGPGRVRAERVRQAVVGAEPLAATEIRLTGMRRVIADRVTASYQAAPHVPLRADVDMSAAAALRAQLKPEAEGRGVRLTYTDLIAAAAVRGLMAVPALNATLEGDLLRRHPAVNLGVAVALEEGLTVPVVRQAERLSLFELSESIRSLAEGARAGSLPPDAYAGGTFTVSNLGQYGVDSFDPILNPPQVGILGVGRIAERLVAVEGQPAVRPVMVLTLTFDHRAVDGTPAARLLGAIKELLENPARLLL